MKPFDLKILQALPLLAALFMAACSGVADYPYTPAANAADENIHINIIAFNDLHGNLEAPQLSIPAPAADGTTIAVPAGGIAYLASAIKTLERRNPNHVVVSAGDLIGASPLVSALFLDEPTIAAVNAIGIDFNAVGNHEFDKGADELLRMQHGGCAVYTERQPCALGSFPGANFTFLAANTFKADGSTLFPATGIKTFGSGAQQVKIGFIGLTLKNTPHIVAPSGVVGLRFRDEAPRRQTTCRVSGVN